VILDVITGFVKKVKIIEILKYLPLKKSPHYNVIYKDKSGLLSAIESTDYLDMMSDKAIPS
jgi:hypothetical protein